MTQRERVLALIVGGLFLAIGFQWAFGKYRSAVRLRQNQVNNLANETQRLQEQLLAGAYADRQMGEYLVRSLPSGPEAAQSDYQSWLLETVREQGLVDAVVDPISEVPVGSHYRRYGFRVSGKTTLEGTVGLLHAVHARDYLHRIREFNLAPAREGGLNLEMTLDAISLNAAPADAEPPTKSSWRVAKSVDESREVVMNRNFFEPPNQPPRYTGNTELVATRGRSNQIRLEFTDPEKTRLTYELDGELPEWVRWDARSGSLSINAPASKKPDKPKPSETTEPQKDGDTSDPKARPADDAPPDDAKVAVEIATEPEDETSQPIKFRVLATDSGYPRRQVEQDLIVRFQDPPPPPPPATPKPEFDDSTQTYLTAVVQGRDGWTAWMNVRTRGQTLKLRPGDGFEIGSMKGKVTEVTSRVVKLDIGGQEYELRPSGKLSELLKED